MIANLAYQLPNPTFPSVMPLAGAGGSPFIAVDH
jgi:hypothetical protein